MKILSVENLEKSFGDLQVLKDISLEVNHGEIVSIIGSSGSGKSTLLRCINRLETIDSGKITVDGQIMVSTENGKVQYANNDILNEIRLKTGLVFQNFNTLLIVIILFPVLVKYYTYFIINFFSRINLKLLTIRLN